MHAGRDSTRASTLQEQTISLLALQNVAFTSSSRARMVSAGTGDGQSFTSQLGQNLQAGIARSLISTAINGGSLQDSLKTNLLTAFIDTGAAQGAFAIGNMKDAGTLDAFTHKLAHALAGCAAGAASAGGDGCAPGAIGAALGEISAEAYGRKSDTVEFAAMISGIGAALAGGDASQISLASAAGANAAANNYLSHQQKADKITALAECKTLACRSAVNLKYLGIDAMQDAGLVIGVGGGIGYQSFEQAAAVVELVKNLPETLQALSAIVSDPEFRAKVGNQVADDYQQRITLQTRAYNDAGWDGSITAGVEAGRLAVDIVAVGTAAVGAGKVAAVAARTGSEVVSAGMAVTANATTNFLENMALRNVQVGAINNFRTADTVNATMKSVASWEPAWQQGSVVADVTLKPGSRVSMVVSKSDYDLIMGGDTSKFGGWATYDNVPNQAYARNQLAITDGMKGNVGNMIVVEITRPIYAQVGVVGRQGAAVGGGNQLHFIVPIGERASTFKVVGGRSLP